MYILLHSKDLLPGEYGFEVTCMIGKRHSTRYGQAFVTNCHSARAAMSFANGVEQGYHEATGIRVEIIKTKTFIAQFEAEMEGA